MKKEWLVTEHYRDGGIWLHYFSTEKEANRAANDMQEFHKSRTYIVEKVVS